MIPKGILIHDVIYLVVKTTCTEMYGEHFKEGSIPNLYWLALLLHSKFQERNFFKEGRM